MRMVRTEILHELPPPMLIDMALVVAAAMEVAVPVAAISMVVEVPMAMPDMSILKNKSLSTAKTLECPEIGRLTIRNVRLLNGRRRCCD